MHRRLTAAADDAGRALAGDHDAAVLTETVAGWLLARYDTAGTLGQFVTDVRGLQVAALWRGLLVQVDIPALLGTASAAPSAAARGPQVWRRLRAYRFPVRGAACALAAARLGSTAICAVTLADTAADGTAVTVGGRPVSIEPNAAAYVAEQRLLRLAAGVPADGPLLATTAGKPMSDKALARLLSEARTELGIVVTSRLVERAARTGRRRCAARASRSPASAPPCRAHRTRRRPRRSRRRAPPARLRQRCSTSTCSAGARPSCACPAATSPSTWA